jgi:cytidine deaminase
MSNEDLVKAATSAREFAYAPYSKFSVGAAILTRSGKVFTGCNVENASLGLTICAERSAIAAAIAAGSQDLDVVVVVADSEKPALPCGACRQVLAEFNPTLKVISATLAGVREEYLLNELLPKPRQGILEARENGEHHS